MRVLHLTHDEFDVLFDILRDTVDVIEGDLITTEDDNGNEVLEDISEYEAYKIYQKLISLRETNKRGEYNKLSEITPERGAKAVENNTSNVIITPQELEGDISTIKDSDYEDISVYEASEDSEDKYNFVEHTSECS